MIIGVFNRVFCDCYFCHKTFPCLQMIWDTYYFQEAGYDNRIDICPHCGRSNKDFVDKLLQEN